MNYRAVGLMAILGLSSVATGAASYIPKTFIRANGNPQSVAIVNAIETHDYFEVSDLLDDYFSANPRNNSSDTSGGEFLPAAVSALLDNEGIKALFGEEDINSEYGINVNKSNELALSNLLMGFSVSYEIRDITTSDREHIVDTQLGMVKDFYQKRSQTIQALIDYNHLDLSTITIRNKKPIDFAIAVDDLALFELIKRNDKTFKVNNAIIEKAFQFKAINIIKLIKSQYQGNLKDIKCTTNIMLESMNLMPMSMGPMMGAGGFNNGSSPLTWGEFVFRNNGMPSIYGCAPNSSFYDHLVKESQNSSFSTARISWKASKAVAADILKEF